MNNLIEKRMLQKWHNTLPDKPNRANFLNLSSNTLQHPYLIDLHKEFYEGNFCLHTYPDYDELRHTFAEVYDADVDEIGFCGGTDSLISALLHAASDLAVNNVFLQTPYFYNYMNYAKCYKNKVIQFSIDNIFLDKTLEQIKGSSPSFIFLTSPCPLTGEIIPKEKLSTWIEQVNTLGHFVVIDQVYSDYGYEPYFDLLKKHKQLLIFHSFSKSFGAAGLRMGFYIGHPILVMRLRSIGIENTVNNISVKYAQFYMQKKSAFAKIRQDIIDWREQAYLDLKKNLPRFHYFQSQANFISLDTKCSDLASSIVDKLINNKIFIKKQLVPYDSYLRITVVSPNILDKVFATIIERSKEY